VVVAVDGRQAIILLEQQAFDLILMDVQMPNMDGLEATAAIRKNEKGRAHIPIVAVTAHAMKGDRERCLAAGMDAYLSKPIRAAELKDTIEKLALSIVKTPAA
jgi:CheY-like chemotaxis protein